MQNVMIDKIINEAFKKVIDESNDPVLQTLYAQYKKISLEYVPDRRADAFAQYDKDKLKQQIHDRLYSLHKPALISLLCVAVNVLGAPDVEASDVSSRVDSIMALSMGGKPVSADLKRTLEKVRGVAEKRAASEDNRKAKTDDILKSLKIDNQNKVVSVSNSRTSKMNEILAKMKETMAEREVVAQKSMSSLKKRSPEINKIVAEMRGMGLSNDLLALINEDGSIKATQ